MKYIIKRNINLFGKNNIIKFEYNVTLNKNNNGFVDFDIGNEEIMINNILTKLDAETIKKFNEIKPIYVSLSTYFFDKLNNLFAIEYETIDSVSKITKKELLHL